MKSHLILFLTIILYSGLWAQDYHTGLGVRLGETPGVSYKRFFTDEIATEAMLLFRNGGFRATVLREFYQPIMHKKYDNLFLVYGYGGHAGFSTWSNRLYYFSGEPYHKQELSFGLGIDGLIGLEYHVLKYPIAFSVSYMPFFELSVPKFFENNVSNASVSIIYTLE